MHWKESLKFNVDTLPKTKYESCILSLEKKLLVMQTVLREQSDESSFL